MQLELTEKEFRRLLDMVYIGNWILNSCRDDDRFEDYDNLEEKQLLDLLSTFVMADDTGLLCDAYNTTELGEQDCTKIFVMEKQRFPQWLAERKGGLKTISDF